MDIKSYEKDGISYYQLYISCPVCYERGKMLPQTYWSHGEDCGGDIYIGENALYRCSKCGFTSHVMNWKYKCPEHSTDAENAYIGVSGAALASVVSMAGQLTVKAGVAWLQEFLKNLENPKL